MRSSNSVLRVALAAAGVCAFTTMAAHAQTSSTADATADSTELLLEEVTVTGSRLITNGNDAPTPVTVITPEQILAAKPTTLYENLVDMPAFSGSQGAANSAPEGGSQGQTGLSVLNLRNMGPQRNLVLMDGRRIPPTSADGLVDVSSIPQMLVERVDVVTGGVSAVYGSDGITGVTNFIMDRDFTGVKVNLQTGISGEGDGKSYDVGIAAGTELFGGRGHIQGSYQRRSDDGIMDSDRDWMVPRWTVQGDGETIPWHLQDYALNNTASYGGVFVCPNGNTNPATCLVNGQPRTLVGYTFNQNGVATPFDMGLRGPANGLTLSALQIGGDGVAITGTQLRSEQRSDQGFLRFDYELTDNINAFVVGSMTDNVVQGGRGTQRTFAPGWRMGACNAYLPAQYQTALGCTPANAGTANEPTFQISKSFKPADHYGMGLEAEVNTRNYYVLGSLEGGFGDGYRWDATYTHSQSEMTVYNLNQNRRNIFAALDAVVNPANGQIVCAVSLTQFASEYPGCVPFNMFGPTAMSKEAMEYMLKPVKNETETELNGLAGTLTGEPLTGWAGPIGMALSGEWRELTMNLQSSSRPNDFLSCNGMRFTNCRTTLIPHGGAINPIRDASQTVAEAAYEINMPLIEGLSAVDSLTFNGAARYAKYKNDPNDSTVVSRDFDATTWKTGLVWDITDTVSLRWTRSKDFRAPSLYELYLPISASIPNIQFDYLQPGAPQVAATPKTGGNPLLEPETGYTSTLGIVWRPNSQFSLALDAYDIKLKDALYELEGANRAIQENCYASGGASPTCQLQERPNGFTDTSPANQMTAHYIRAVNIAEQTTTGIDLESSFNMDLFDQPLSLRALVTYQPHLVKYIPFQSAVDVAGTAYPEIGGLPMPVWKASLYVRYRLSERWTVDLSERFRSSLSFSTNESESQIGDVPSVAYTNMTVSYDVPTPLTQVNVFLNVQNVFDKAPPAAGQLGSTFPGQLPGVYAIGDDVLGRYFTLGVRMRL